jgi:hypothetical protein
MNSEHTQSRVIQMDQTDDIGIYYEKTIQVSITYTQNYNRYWK